MKVWTLSQGEYSSYSILALFTTKELAEEALAAHKEEESYLWGEPRIETLELYGEMPKPIEYCWMKETLWDNGTTDEASTRIESKLPWNIAIMEPAKRISVRWVRAPIHKGMGGRLEVHGQSKEHVRKVFSETRAMIRNQQLNGMRPQSSKGKVVHGDD